MEHVPVHEHVLDTGKGELTLEDLGPLLPGMGDIMPLVGSRMSKCYHAGRAGNRPLARFQLQEAVNLLEKGAVLRPKYADSVAAFVEQDMAAVRAAIDDGDWAAFAAAFDAVVAAANAYHDLYDKPFLRWKVPADPPPDLDLTPRAP